MGQEVVDTLNGGISIGLNFVPGGAAAKLVFMPVLQTGETVFK